MKPPQLSQTSLTLITNDLRALGPLNPPPLMQPIFGVPSALLGAPEALADYIAALEQHGPPRRWERPRLLLFPCNGRIKSAN
jgi:hypothetical protein